MIRQDKINSTLKEILSNKQFTVHYEKSWREKLHELISKFLEHFHLKPKDTDIDIPWLKKLISFLSTPEAHFIGQCVLVAAVGFIIWYVYRLMRRGVVAHLDEKTKLQKLRQPGTIDDWEKEAERFSSEGNYLEGINAIIHALYITLSTKGILRAAPGTTNREYVYILKESSRNSLSKTVAKVVLLHEEKSYALKGCSIQDFDTCMELYKQCKMDMTS